MSQKMNQYGVWVKEQNPDESYWMLYDSLEDAVSENGDGTEVFLLVAKKLGKYERKVSIIQTKEKRAKKTKRGKA